MTENTKIYGVVAEYTCRNQWGIDRDLKEAFSYKIYNRYLHVIWNEGEDEVVYSATYKDIENEWMPTKPDKVRIDDSFVEIESSSYY